MQGFRQRRIQHILDQRAFATPTGTGHHGQRTQRNIDRHISQIVVTRFHNAQKLSGYLLGPGAWYSGFLGAIRDSALAGLTG